MPIKIALAGNPNCGKTTMFNHLTGSNQHVGNWPGVTVEKKEGRIKGSGGEILQDLPGIYSLSPYTLEEVVARDYLVQDPPDVILNLVDGTNIERNLYLTTQLIELGIPVVVAVNMMDLVHKNGDRIDLQGLSAALGCPVCAVSALTGEGCDQAVRSAVRLAGQPAAAPLLQPFTGRVAQAIQRIQQLLDGRVPPRLQRWYAIKLFERDSRAMEQLALPEDLSRQVEACIVPCEEEWGDDAESILTNQRYTCIAQLVARTVHKSREAGTLSVSDRIDRVVTNRIAALPIFAAVMLLVYTIAMGSTPVSVGTLATDWTNDVLFGQWIPPLVQGLLTSLGCAPWLIGLITDGIVAGVGAVLGFVPQMLVLFFLLAVLEDVGYMARIAFLMDRIFRRFGLSGKSFIPMLVGTGCGVPGVMASRTIENDQDRRLTVMTTCFIPCSAKMPIVGLFAGALFGGSGLVAVSAYFIGLAAILVSGILLKKTRLFAGDPAPFVMELPAYHIPAWGSVLRTTGQRGWSFVRRAGTVILASTVLLWFLQSFGVVNGVFGMVQDNNTSLLAAIGGAVSLIFAPLGFGNWQSTVATVTGLIAKENVVSTFAVLFGYTGDLSDSGQEIWGLISAHFTALSAYSFLIFNLLCAPCFAAMGAIKREMNSPRWTLFAIGYMCVFAYGTSLMVYQLGGLISGQLSFGPGTLAALALLAVLLVLLLRPAPRAGRQPRRSAARTLSAFSE